MKRKIIVILSVVMILTLSLGTIAHAAGGSNVDKAIDRAQQRLDFMEEAQPLVQEITSNRQQIASLTSELKAQHLQTKAHIASLKTDLDSITDEQIEQLQSLISQVEDCKANLAATNPQMVQERQDLRTARRNREYDSMISAYNNILSIQEQRIDTINKLIDINTQIAAI